VGHLTALTSSFKDCQKVFRYTKPYEPSVSFIQKVANKLGRIGIQEENELLEAGIDLAEQESQKTKPSEIFSVLIDVVLVPIIRKQKTGLERG
jgi:hypothetical protein